MHLPHPFYKFPFRFDLDRLRAEVNAIPEDAWRWHPDGFRGNSALPLITTNGELNDDFAPPMRPTEYLLASPYIMQVLSRFQTLHGRARLMRLEPGDGVPAHVDWKYYWRTRTRVHIPIVTDPAIRFQCGPDSVHMAAGEAWTFDNWRVHQVVNETQTRRIHLTFDTYGSADFWAMARPSGEEAESVFVPFLPAQRTQLAYEGYIGDPVLSPSEVELQFTRIANDAAAFPDNDQAAVARLRGFVTNLVQEWRMVWFAKGPTEDGLPIFRSLQQQARLTLKALPESIRLGSNGRAAVVGLGPMVNALIASEAEAADEGVRLAEPEPLGRTFAAAPAGQPRFEAPVFIVAAPRSGSTMLFESLATHEALWSLGGEGYGQIENIPGLAPMDRNYESNRLTAADLKDDIRAALHANFVAGLVDADGKPYRATGPEGLRFLEKTPKNALRIPFLKAAYPDAKFIFLHREARSNIASIIEAWSSGRFVTYPDLPEWAGPDWSLLLIPGWRDLNGANLVEIALRQWRDTNETILQDLADLPREDWCAVRYEELTAYRRSTLKRLCDFMGLDFAGRFRQAAGESAPLSRTTLTEPAAEKWRAHAAAIETVLPRAMTLADMLAKVA